MKTSIVMILTSSLLFSTALAETVNFDDGKIGEAPAGWTAAKTGSGTSKWTIEKDDTAPSRPNVLKQSGEATYPVCIKDDTSLKDGFVEVKFKAVSGQTDQAAGVIWRCWIRPTVVMKDNGPVADARIYDIGSPGTDV